MKDCPSCGKELPDNAQFCRYCGYDQTTTMKINREAKQTLSPSAGMKPPDVPIGDSHPHTPTTSHKAVGKLSMPVRNTFSMVLAHAQDPKPEEPYRNLQKGRKLHVLTWGWLPILALTSALGVFSVAYAYTSSRLGAKEADPFFWLGLLLIFVPAVVRLLSATATRIERLSLLCFISVCFYLIHYMINPLAFTPHDSFIHWLTADNITKSRHLFDVNPLLPASPFYPGMEIVTNALSTMSGLNNFQAGVVVLIVAHIIIILSLFMLYEHITKSARIGGIATIIYMTNPHFLFFDTQYSYESLALPLASIVLFIMARQETLQKGQVWSTMAACLILGAAIVTHHLTGIAFDGLLLLWTLMYIFQRSSSTLLSYRLNLALTGLFGACLVIAWANLPGNPVIDYLSSYFNGALRELGHVLGGTSAPRQLFGVYTGQPAPIWQRLLAISSVILITLCLPFGLLCLWKRYRYSALVWMLSVFSLFYPVSQLFRFTNFGAEITDRSAAFLFIPISCILAIFITQFWPLRRLNWQKTSLITCALAIVFLGGTVLGAGPPSSLLPGPYLVGADERSVEPEGIQTALWARSFLGPNSRVSTDRTNRLLMSIYGEQDPVTTLKDNIDVTEVFFSPTFGPNEVSILRRAHVHYLVVDLRLSTALPVLGFYFEVGESGSFARTTPISRQALTKFARIPGINRVYDSGDIVIYDVEGIINASEKP